jgi:hypothetical protein
MKHKSVLAVFLAIAVVLSMAPLSVFALWVNDKATETEYRTFQCNNSGGSIEVCFYDDAGELMNFYRDDERFVVDKISLKDEYEKEGLQDAYSTLYVYEEVVTIVYPVRMFGHLEVKVNAVSGYTFSRFTDVTCGCYAAIEETNGIYTLPQETVPFISAVFDEDMDETLLNYIPAVTNPDLSITLNGAPVYTDVPPYIENSRTMAPVRSISEALGAKVEWNSESRVVTISSGDGTVISLTIGDAVMTITKPETAPVPVTMDVSALIKDDRTFVPVRYIAEALGLAVDWNGATRTVILTNN